MSADLFKDLANATAAGNSEYLRSGNYPILQLVSYGTFLSPRTKEQRFQLTFDILEDFEPATSAYACPGHKKGKRVQHVWTFKYQPEAEIKAFLLAASGLEEDDLTQEHIAEIIEEQVLKGRLVRAEVNLPKEGKSYTRKKFFKIDEEIQDKEKELRKAAGLPSEIVE